FFFSVDMKVFGPSKWSTSLCSSVKLQMAWRGSRGTTSVEIKSRSQLVFEVLVAVLIFSGTKPVVFGCRPLIPSHGALPVVKVDVSNVITH
ncbi:hypothetical protein IFM89_013698, partial [Coptis chinensis]